MPSLSQLTDAYTPQETVDSFPVESPFTSVPVDADGVRRVRIDTAPPKPYDNLDAAVGPSFGEGVTEHPLIKQLFGLGGETRYQLWPERMVREGLSAAGDVMSGKVPQWAIDPETGDVHTSPNMIEKAQEMSALAGSGGLAGTTDATLGATPFLRPALKYKDKLYKGKDGQQHLDVIPESIYPEFQKKAMSGDDINEFKFGFVNDKGHFLDRETALKYGIDTGLVDPQAGKFGALTSTLMADSSKPGIAIESMKQASPFFSAVEHNVNAIPQAKMTGDQWLGTLSNKPGVKGEELAWTGLQDFLLENKGKPVTKEQIVEHLNNNKVELKEVNKGGNPDAIAKAYYESMPNNTVKWEDLPQSTKDTFDRLAPKSDTKYHGYQLPGGDNYREMLLTLPEKKHDLPKGLASSEDADKFLAAKESNYRSSHWDEPNILAHVRMNDRTIDGKKSLHLEEVQSDWHQTGRDKGYKSDTPKFSPEKHAELESLRTELKGLRSQEIKAFKEGSKEFSADEFVKLDKWKRFNELSSEKRNAENPPGVPDAPFKKSWHELALKRMLREAAEKGYDRLSWTPGEAQAARYDLSKSIKGLEYFPEKRSLDMIDKNGNRQTSHDMTPEKLPDFVGKEAAKKLLETSANRKYNGFDTYGPKHELHGVDLKIGGEGMKGFYDQMIPKSLERIGKEHGVKVKQAELPGKLSNRMGQPPEMHKVHYIDIPQSLKDQAMHKGFPLFSAGGHMLIPVSHDPFKDDKTPKINLHSHANWRKNRGT